MLKNILKVNRPDFIELTTETKTVTAKWENDDYNLDDINVKLNQDNEHLAIFLTAQTSKVKWIKLRWNNLSWDKNVRFLGDAWERGYGDMEWKGMNPNRFMPWYFCAKSDFSGYHNFSKTLRQHNIYAREYHQELNKRKIWK